MARDLSQGVRRPGRALAGVAAMATLGATAAVLATPATSFASSHREAPLIAGIPKLDNTDTYAFVSPDKPDTVTLIADWIPFEEPNGGPNFYPFENGAHYDINIDNNGDGKADVTYRWTFSGGYQDKSQFLYNTGVVNSLSDPTLNFKQTYKLEKITGGNSETVVDNGTAAPSDVGKASMPNYASLRDQAISQVKGGGQTLAGQADDPFFLDLRVFDLLYGGDLSEVGHDTLSGYNVNTIALQVPKSAVAIKGDATANPVIGVWSSTERQSTVVYNSGGPGQTKESGDYVQVSRLGMPLVNEVVVPVMYKDAFDAIPPSADHTVQPVVDKVLDPIVPALIQKIYKIPAPPAPRDDIFEVFLTGICKQCKAPDGKVAAPIDLNSQMLNRDGLKGSNFVPAEEMRLNMSVAPSATPNRLGVVGGDTSGFPNGRRLTDDVVDIELQALEGILLTKTPSATLKGLGDGVNTNDVAFGSAFPYVALPHDVAVNNASGSTTSNGSVGANTGNAQNGGTAGGSASGNTSAAGGQAPTNGVATGGGGTAADSSPFGPVPVIPAVAALLGVAIAGSGVVLARRRA